MKRCPAGKVRARGYCVNKERAESFGKIMDDLASADTYFEASHGFMSPYIRKEPMSPERRQKYQDKGQFHWLRAYRRTDAWIPKNSQERKIIIEEAQGISKRDLIRRGLRK